MHTGEIILLSSNLMHDIPPDKTVKSLQHQTHGHTVFTSDKKTFPDLIAWLFLPQIYEKYLKSKF